MDPDKRRALSDFYREEFIRHLDHLESSGAMTPKSQRMHQACTRLISNIETVCWRDDFPAVAETLLSNFDVLTRLSELDPRQQH